MHHESKDNKENIPHRTTEALFTNQDRMLKCAFCNEKHYPDKCAVVTDVTARIEIIWNRNININV